jgi:hypothetical protein
MLIEINCPMALNAIAGSGVILVLVVQRSGAVQNDVPGEQLFEHHKHVNLTGRLTVIKRACRRR